jgi:uncharacterized integral membrane protein
MTTGHPVSQTRATEATFWTTGRVIGLGLAILVLLLAIANFDPIEVNFLVFRLTVPLFFLIVGVLLIGFAWGWLSKRRSR